MATVTFRCIRIASMISLLSSRVAENGRRRLARDAWCPYETSRSIWILLFSIFRLSNNPKNHPACLEKPSHEFPEPCLRIVWVAELVQHDALPAGLQSHRALLCRA